VDPTGKQLAEHLSVLSREKTMVQVFSSATAKMGPVPASGPFSRTNNPDSAGLPGLSIPQISTDYVLKSGLLLCSSSGSHVPTPPTGTPTDTPISSDSSDSSDALPSFVDVLIQTLVTTIYKLYFQQPLTLFISNGHNSNTITNTNTLTQSLTLTLLPATYSEITFLSQLIQISTLGMVEGLGVKDTNPVQSDLKTIPGVDVVFVRHFLPYLIQQLLSQLEPHLGAVTETGDGGPGSGSGTGTGGVDINVDWFDVSKIMTEFQHQYQYQVKNPNNSTTNTTNSMSTGALSRYEYIANCLCVYIVEIHRL